jgi:hypothetical protein
MTIQTYGKANILTQLTRRFRHYKKSGWGVCGMANNPEWDLSEEEN